MKKRGLSLGQLAIASGIDKGNLSRTIREGNGYSSKSLDQLADALGTTLGGLFSDDPEGLSLPSGFRRVPIVPGKIHAGLFASVGEAYADGVMTEFAITSVPVGSRSVAFLVEGDSMEPHILAGSLVVVDPDYPPKPGNFIALENNEHEAQLRIYAPRGLNAEGQEYFSAIPANKLYPRLRSDKHGLRIAGVVRDIQSPEPRASSK